MFVVASVSALTLSKSLFRLPMTCSFVYMSFLQDITQSCLLWGLEVAPDYNTGNTALRAYITIRNKLQDMIILSKNKRLKIENMIFILWNIVSHL